MFEVLLAPVIGAGMGELLKNGGPFGVGGLFGPPRQWTQQDRIAEIKQQSIWAVGAERDDHYGDLVNHLNQILGHTWELQVDAVSGTTWRRFHEALLPIRDAAHDRKSVKTALSEVFGQFNDCLQ
jgi:hypothetical protein